MIVLALMLTAGGGWAGLTLLRNLGILLAAVPLASLLAGWLIALTARPRPQLTDPGDVHVGEKAVWQLAVTVRLPRWVPLWVIWRVGDARFTIPVVAGGCAIFCTPSRRGVLRAAAETLTCYDPLGLARVRIPLRVNGDLLVLPHPLPPPPEAAAVTAAAAPDAAAGAPGRRGRGTPGLVQSGELRDYRPGDALSSVHWRQSARVDRLLVVDREHERRRPLRLRLDVRADAYAAVPRQSPSAAAGFEEAVSRAAGLIEAWARAGHDIELRLGPERHRTDGAHSIALLRRLATATATAPHTDTATVGALAGGGDAPAADTAYGRAADAMPQRDADVVITGAAADPPGLPAPGGVVLTADPDSAAPVPPAAPDPGVAAPAPTAPESVPAASAPAPRAAPSSRPELRTARGQPLAAALIVVGLWYLAVTALTPLFTPAPWASRSLAVAAATMLIPALVRTALPERAGFACTLGLVGGTGTVWWCSRGTGQAQAWLADPVTQLRAFGTILRNGVAPLATGGALGFALCLFTLLLAWACALMSAGGGDRCGATGLAPAAALLAPGIVLGVRPDDAVVFAAGAGVLALILTAAPVPVLGTGRARRRGGAARAGLGLLGRAFGSLAGAAAVTALAVALTGVAVSRLPAAPARMWSWNVSGAGGADVTVPDTTLTLGQDLVRGSAATAFEYSTEAVPEGASLRFTLAVIRDLDGEVWEPLDDPGPTGADSLVAPTGSDTLTAGAALAAAGVQVAEVRSGDADLPRIHISIRNLASSRLPLAQSTALVTAEDGEDTAAGRAALDPTQWAWVSGTSTVIARGAEATGGSSYTAVGWNAVAGVDGSPQIFPPYAAAAAAPDSLAAYTDTPPGTDMIAATARDVVEAAGLGGVDADPAARAAALAAWFHTGDFVYDETAPGSFDADTTSTPVDTVNSFLIERHGYCVHYAAAFTLMARSLDLPTRIAIGYASRGGESTTTVSGRELHAWPEVWFDGVGWVAFEPTPGGAGARADTGLDAQPAPTAQETGAGASVPASPTPAAEEPAGATATPGAGGAAVADGRSGHHALWAVGAVTIGLLLAGPALARAWRRRRRLGRIRDGSKPAGAAWEELRDTATDLGLWGPAGRADRGPRARTQEALAEYLAAVPGLDADARRALAQVADAVVAESFADRVEGAGADDRSHRRRLARLVRTGSAGLGRTTSASRRLRARLLPASLWRRPR